MEQTKWLWCSDQGDDDLPVGQVGQVTPSTRQDPADPGDKTQQIVGSWTCIHDEAERAWNTKYKSKLKGEREGKKQGERDNKYCVRVRVCLCVWAQLVLHVVTTETVPAHVCACVCAVFLSASPFVGWPSHLFHGYICDLLGSDWYGNIIIQARILSLPSLTLSLSPSLLSLSPPTNFLSRVLLWLSRCYDRSLAHIKTANSSPLLSFCCLTQLP